MNKKDKEIIENILNKASKINKNIWDFLDKTRYKDLRIKIDNILENYDD
jgi:hypothetical protein